MCVIIAKPAGIALPSEKELRNCWQRNNDGAGVAWAQNKKVRIEKGFMKLKDLLEFLNSRDWKSYPMLIHLRAATHGAISPHHCHPFPLSTSKEKLMKTKVECGVAVAHNGIFTGYGEKGKGLSDTQEFIQKVLAPLKSQIRKPAFQKLLQEAIRGSKLAFLFSDGDFHLYGEFKKHNGCYFSNGSYEVIPVYHGDWLSYPTDWYPTHKKTVTPEYCDWCGATVVNGMKRNGPKFSYTFCYSCSEEILRKRRRWGKCVFCNREGFLYEVYEGDRDYVCLDCLVQIGSFVE
ncbi:MAG: hypothetical protein DRO05_03650 [Thermoproteota archaeon]|nr:MAG: hypothetical protein DRO05_03650 [Candidatus Korarchaeota archaeon]